MPALCSKLICHACRIAFLSFVPSLFRFLSCQIACRHVFTAARIRSFTHLHAKVTAPHILMVSPHSFSKYKLERSHPGGKRERWIQLSDLPLRNERKAALGV